MATCPTCLISYPEGHQACPADGAALLPDEAFAAVDKELQPGDTVGEYTVEGKLGEGGFGVVFSAVHPVIGKKVAIKVLNRQFSSNPEMVSRFISEARAVNQIQHRNIIDIFAFGQLEDGRHYYIMEHISGITLDDYVEQCGCLSFEQAFPIFRAVGRALDAAHQKGIAHRDLKPENVMISVDEDGTPFAKLLDFGIAKLLSADGGVQHKTQTGAPIGTPHFMSPEQSRGRQVDHRTDIYSFGILVYQCLTGRLPFDGDDYMEILLKQMGENPPLLSEVRPGMPTGFDDAVFWMMAKDPAARPSSLAEAVKALEDVAIGAGVDLPVAPRTSGFTSQATPIPSAMISAVGGAMGTATTMAGATSLVTAQQPPRRSPVVAILLGLLLLGGGGAAAFFFLGARGQTAPPVATNPVKNTPVAEPPVVAPPADAALSKTVALNITGTPDGTRVLDVRDVELGTAPGEVLVARGDSPIELIFRADGHHDLRRQVIPDKDMPLALSLKPVAKKKKKKRKRKKKSTKDDIENPFD